MSQVTEKITHVRACQQNTSRTQKTAQTPMG